MRVLIVEDDKDKAAALAELVSSEALDPGAFALTSVDSLGDAARLLGAASFDLVILDLMLPYLHGGSASSSAGLELLRQVRTTGGPNTNTTVVGVSAFPDEVAANREAFEAAGVLLITYAESGSWRAALAEVVRQVALGGGARIDVDFLAVCALEEERAGFAAAVTEVSQLVLAGLNLRIVQCAESGMKGALLRLGRMGLVAATHETAAALQLLRPEVLMMTGICAGFSKNAQLGQLLIASPAWEYQAGKWSVDGFEIAPHQINLDPETRSLIDHQLGLSAFVDGLEVGLDPAKDRPRRRSAPALAPVATGSAVIADARRLEPIEKQHRKVAGLDMETFGMYYAATHATQKPKHFFSAKVVVDLADASKDDDLHHYGAVVSARAGLKLAAAMLERR